MVITEENVHEKMKEYMAQLEKRKKEKAEIENKIIIERPVYHTAREYICKFPAKLMKYLPHKNGDKVKFILDKSKGEPKLILEYVGKK